MSQGLCGHATTCNYRALAGDDTTLDMTKKMWFPLVCMQTMLLASSSFAAGAQAPKTVNVPLVAERWQVVDDGESSSKPDVQFATHEGIPNGVLVIKSGSAALRDFAFRDGTIEFDMKALAPDIPGIQFRQQGPLGKQNAEEFYLRTFPDCRASNDCIQYAPVINGFMLWDSYPQYQTQAFVLDGWNHVKLVVSGRRMNVYLNHVATPALVVGGLEGESPEGGIQFRGPAFFANLQVTPGVVEGLPAQATADPTAGERGMVRRWQLGPQTTAHFGHDPSYSELPKDSEPWKAVTVGRFGMVNLNRNFEMSKDAPRLTWLRYTVDSDRERSAPVSLGWLGQVWVFVNGKPVTQGKNFYYPDAERRAPDGRMSLENGSFTLPLEKGKNEVVLAMYTATHDAEHTVTRYGWGVEMRFEDPKGIGLEK